MERTERLTRPVPTDSTVNVTGPLASPSPSAWSVLSTSARPSLPLSESVVTAIPATATIDPVFDLIATHRKTHIAHVSSLELQARFERRYGIGAGGWISTQPCHDEDDAFTAFVAEPATTVQGLLAKLAYFAELAGEFETEWMVNDRAEAAVIIRSFAASLKNIGVQS